METDQPMDHEMLVSALRQVLTEGDNDQQPILVKRIPFICRDIRDIKRILYAIIGGLGTILVAVIINAITN